MQFEAFRQLFDIIVWSTKDMTCCLFTELLALGSGGGDEIMNSSQTDFI